MVRGKKGLRLIGVVFLTAFMGATVLPYWCQQVPALNPSVTDLLAKLYSRHLSERIDALDEIASDQALLHSRKIQAALMDLLNQESEAFREDKTFNTVAAASAEDGGEEENSQYLFRSASPSTCLSIGMTRVRLARWCTQETSPIHRPPRRQRLGREPRCHAF